MTSHTTESRDRMGSDVVNDVSGSGVFPSGSDYKEDGVSSKNENRNTNYTRMLCTIFPTTTNRIARVWCVEKTGTKLQEGQNVEI
jgi:hypothetical protein